MNIFKRTQGNLIKTTMCVKKEDLNSSEFTIQDIIQHLLDHERYIVTYRSDYKELLDACVNTLQENAEDIVDTIATSISVRPGGSARTLFYPSCRIIHVNFTETPRSHRTSVRRLTVEEHEKGYKVDKAKGSHSAIVIKIERMTDISCFASWSLIS